MINNKVQYLTRAVILSLTLGAPTVMAKTVKVFNKYDSGPNTFRAAIHAANADPAIDRIKFHIGRKRIALKTPVVYTGAQALTINGKGATITDNGADNLLIASGGGDLNLKNIDFVRAQKSGVVVNVPAGNAIRQQRVSLSNVVLYGNGWYGLHFDDQSGGDGQGSDSATSLDLVVVNSSVKNNNNFFLDESADDKDGIRVDEGGEGDVTATIVNSVFDDNAAEGIEIDERGGGDVIVNATGSSFSNNGDQPQKPSVLEDGLDVDEADSGDIWVTLVNTKVKNNQDEGLDLDGADEGSIYLNLVNFDASSNLDDNIKVTLLQNANPTAGTIVARFSAVTVNNSDDGDGIKLENFDNGDDENPVGTIFATAQNSQVTGNDSDDIQVEADSGTLLIRNSGNPKTDVTPNIQVDVIP